MKVFVLALSVEGPESLPAFYVKGVFTTKQNAAAEMKNLHNALLAEVNESNDTTDMEVISREMNASAYLPADGKYWEFQIYEMEVE